MQHAVLSVNLGNVRPFRGEDEPSAIAKHPATSPVAVGPLGLEGDAQADLTVHGGIDKAVHHYPRDHYSYWHDYLGGHPLLEGEGALGENIATLGLLEDQLCIGDHFRLGTALVEVSQGRQPCWKLGHRFGNPRVTAEVVRTGRSGWYYRVIEPGMVAAGDQLELIDRTLPEWTIARTFALLVGGGHKRDPAALPELAGMAALAMSWRVRAEKLQD